MLWTKPSSCSSVYTAVMESSIQSPSPRLLQPAITSANASSTVTSKRGRTRPRERLTWSASSGNTARGSGEYHQISPSSPGMGKRPCRYPSRTVSGSSSEMRGQAGARGVAVHRRALERVLVPAVGVLPVVEVLREPRQLQRVEGVAHDRELVCLLHADRLLREARLRPVRQARRMERDRADLDALPRPEVAGDVIDHLLRLQVRVVVRDRDRKRVEVELPGTEGADDEVLARKGLVRRRRLVDAAGDRLEVVDRERPREEVAVPADDVEGVVVEDVGLVAVAHADLDRELALLADRLQLRRRVDVAVVVRRAFHDLPVLVAVPARDLDQPRRLEHEIPL